MLGLTRCIVQCEVAAVKLRKTFWFSLVPQISFRKYADTVLYLKHVA